MSPAVLADAATNPAQVVAFQGAAGAYSHLACREALPDMVPLPCATFEDAFAAVREGRAACGLIPIENSTAGRVADIHLLPEGGLFITAEHFLRVRHQLLAPQSASLASVKRVYSHVQALSQCRNVIRDLGLEAIVSTDTAGSAKEVAERGDPTAAAIASSIAGELYGLQTLRADIEDNSTNTTRFVKLERARLDPDPAQPEGCLTSLMFKVRSVPAALYKALGGFATNGVNVVKLESYMTDGFRVAEFYCEIEGHPAQPGVQLALDELGYFSRQLKVLGVYRAHPYRSGD